MQTVSRVGHVMGRRSGREVPKRFLNLHEYASMKVMSDFGIQVPRSQICETPEEAEQAYASEACGGEANDVVVKAQVLAGGRGKGTFTNGFQGGVHLATHAGEAGVFAGNMIGQDLVTKQTGPEGKRCDKVLLVERLYMRREMYFSIVMDRASSGPVLVGSPKGGMNIEEVAEQSPEHIHTLAVDIKQGPTDAQLTTLAENMGFSTSCVAQAVDTMRSLYDLFIAKDATQIEINPLAETVDEKVFVSDAKLNFDSNAEFRQPDIWELRDTTQEDAREVEAAKYDLNYIGLDGSIGCMVNGAGLAMATMDILKLHGGSPANFLDVGGGATEETVSKAFEILNADPQVKAIVVNIFGGIMRCDVIAAGIIAAASKMQLTLPIVLRLQGTNVEQARDLIEGCGLKIVVVDDLDEAAKKVVKMANIVEQAHDIGYNVGFSLPI